MMPVSGLRLDPPVPIPDHVLVQHADESVRRDPGEAPLARHRARRPPLTPCEGRQG